LLPANLWWVFARPVIRFICVIRHLRRACADWAGYDLEVNGGRYSNHHGAGPQTTIQLASGATAADPLLAEIDISQLVGQGSLYQGQSAL
jgi:hypothetical protein